MSEPEKKPTAQDERAHSRRRQVLDAAQRCFGRSGFHAASMADISRAAGMSAGHIYNYFENKDAIIVAFVEQNTDRANAMVRDISAQDDPLEALISSTRQHVLEGLLPSTWALPLEIYAEASRNPVIAALVQQADRGLRAQFLALVRDGRLRRGLNADEAMLVGRLNTIVSMFHGLPVRAVHDPALDSEALADGFLIALKALLLGP